MADALLATFGGVVDVAGFYTPDDGFQHVIVADAVGDIYEVFFNPTQGVFQTRIAQLPGAVSVGAFYSEDDHYRHAIIGTSGGDVVEVFYHPQLGSGQTTIANFAGISSVAGFYSPDDQYRHAIVGTRGGDLNEVFFHPTKGSGTAALGNFGGIRSLDALYSHVAHGRQVVFATEAGVQYHLTFQPSYPQRLTELSRNPAVVRISMILAPGDQTERVFFDDNTMVTVWALGTGGNVIYRFTNRQESSQGVTCMSGYMTPDKVQHRILGMSDGRVLERYGPPLDIPPPPPPPPVTQIASFTASPNDGYIPVGQSATLAWDVRNCGGGCNVSLQGKDGPGYSHPVLNASSLPTTGSMKVTPVETLTRYTLTATGQNGSDSKTKQVQLYSAGGGGGGGGVFYFKMTNPGGVTPCFTTAVYAPDGKAETAKAIAVAQNGGYQATQIDASQFTTACDS